MDMSNFSYKGWKSTTLHLVLLGYISATALLVFSLIDMLTWKETAFSMLALYIGRDGITKISEKWAEVYTAKYAASTKEIAP
jgi:hypothetical protein